MTPERSDQDIGNTRRALSLRGLAFKGRFWREWVVGRRNKPTEVKSKDFIYEGHLKDAFGDLRLDQIGAGEVAAFRASLVEKKLSEKRINNILAVLSKPMKYASTAS